MRSLHLRWILVSLVIAATFPAWAMGQPQPADPTVGAASLRMGNIEFDHLEQGTLYFKSPEGMATPKPVETGLHELKYLGVLKPPASDAAIPPYFLFTGRACENCQQDTAIYAIRPTGGKPTAFVHPGKIFDHRTRALVTESHAFFGRCLPRNNRSVYVVFQKERVDRRKQLQPSVLIAEPGLDHMNERLLESHLPRLKDTLYLVKTKACHEITGRNRLMLPRPMDLNLRRNATEDPDDSDKADDDKNDDEARDEVPKAAREVSP